MRHNNADEDARPRSCHWLVCLQDCVGEVIKGHTEALATMDNELRKTVKNQSS